jgi:hypothetical protein
MRIIYLLCRVLQQKSLDILNAMDLISTTKALLWTLRDAKFDLLFAHVQMFAHNMRLTYHIWILCIKKL